MERQRTVGCQYTSGLESTNDIAFAVKQGSSNSNPSVTKPPKKDRPYCTHCKYNGHTVNKCYKLHCYPPGFKQRQIHNDGHNTSAIVNPISYQSSDDTKIEKDTSSIADFFPAS